MVRVVSTSVRVRDFTGGLSTFDVEGSTVGRLIAEMERRYPGLGTFVESEMAIAIDGDIHQDALGEAVGPDSEIVLIPKIGGG
jgi:sulfur-carrier protein